MLVVFKGAYPHDSGGCPVQRWSLFILTAQSGHLLMDLDSKGQLGDIKAGWMFRC